MSEEINREFLGKARELSQELLEEDNFLVIGHHDADGITSCAIMVDFLRSRGKKVEFMTIKQLDSVIIKKIKDRLEKRMIVFTDMGSGQLSLLEKKGIENFFIFDHHVPERKNERQLNPSFYSYDGGIDISGAGVAYMAARAFEHKNFAHLAVVGALGDMQDSKGKLKSLNRVIIKDAVGEGTLKVEHDLRLFGRQSRPLIKMLSYASDPILPGLTGNDVASQEFLQYLGIGLKRDDNLWKNYVDLSKEEKEKLISGLYMHLLDYGVPEYIIQGMVGEVYILVKEEVRTELRDAKEFATVMNACGRQKQSDIGVKVCLGDRKEYWKKARNLLQKHKRMLKIGLNYLIENGVSKLENLYYFDASGVITENLVGVIAGMGYSARVFGTDKPILALAEDGDDASLLKVSARANWGLVRGGIHLGDAMREGSQEVGGEGGGHNIAAGASIPKNRKEDFLKKVNEIFKKQLEK